MNPRANYGRYLPLDDKRSSHCMSYYTACHRLFDPLSSLIVTGIDRQFIKGRLNL
jgi:hypothetical protein